METSTPDNVLGVASNITICEDLDTLQKAACGHEFGVCVCVCVCLHACGCVSILCVCVCTCMCVYVFV